METQNNRSKEPSVIGSIIAALCIVVYLFALVQGFVRVYLSIEGRKIIAEQEFKHIADLALSSGLQGFMDERFIQTMNNALVSSKTIEALIVTGADGGHAFEKKTGHAIYWVNNSPRFKNKFTLSNQNHYLPLAISDIRDANIKAVASSFDYNEFAKILRETLLLIIIGLAFSFFTILLQFLTGKQEKEKIKGEMVYVTTPEPSMTAAAPVRQREDVYQERVSSESGPKGLYSPRSNIGWEEYTKDRMDSELHRCSSTEKDLALLLMEFSDIHNDLLFKQVAEEAAGFFTSRDLLFEYGKQGVTVILPGVGFDIAIAKAEKFYQRFMEKFPVTHSAASSLYIGLSSRSGRLINADRLILEANEALKKAKSDSRTSIIAFKSDPEKYREFIRTHS